MIGNEYFSGVLLDDELIHDYEFELKIHHLIQNVDICDYFRKKLLVYAGDFE